MQLDTPALITQGFTNALERVHADLWIRITPMVVVNTHQQ